MPDTDALPDSTSIDEAIYRQVRDAIGGQKLPPGTRLREDEMRSIFSVSRARIRKVFARLAYDGLVVIEPNRGASVARPTADDARALYEARRAIEGAIVTAAAAKLDAEDGRMLREHVERERRADAARDYAEMISLSGEFHLHLAAIAGNVMLSKFLGELIIRESLVIQAYERPGKPSCSVHEHEQILDAVEAGDDQGAVALMNAHLESIERRLDLEGDSAPSLSLRSVFLGR